MTVRARVTENKPAREFYKESCLYYFTNKCFETNFMLK